MSVLVLGLASYPSIPPNLNQDITDFQLPLGNFAFAEDITIELKETIGVSDVEAEVEEEEEAEEEEDVMEDANDAIADAQEEINKAQEKIDEAAENGKETTLAQEQLNQAISKLEMAQLSFDSENFEEAEELADEAEDLASEARGKLIGKTEADLEDEGEKDEAGEEEIEIEVEVEDGVAKVKVEFNDEEHRFLVTDDASEDGIADAILNEFPDFPLDKAGIMAIWDFKVEHEDEGVRIREDKMQVCHMPPGNPSKAHTITVGGSAVDKHLAHGDGLGPCGQEFSVTDRLAKLGEKQAEREAKLAEKETRLVEKQAEREARLAEKQMDVEARLAEKKSKSLQRAEDLIQRLEQRIVDLELRLQTLLAKVETGEYFGHVPKIDPITNSYSISIDGTASSLFDESVTSNVSGEIFIENLVTESTVSKFKVTGGEIFVGDNIYDVVFGKARISSTGPSGEKDSMVLILQAIDSEGNGNTIRLTLNFDSALEGDFGTEPIELEIIKNSKISGQWSLSASGQLSLLQADV